MKRLLLLAVICLGFSYSVKAQTCECTEEEEGEGCKIECPEGSLPSCDQDWWGDCDCGCEPNSGGGGENYAPNEDLEAFNLKRIEKFQGFLKDQDKVRLVGQILNEIRENAMENKGNGRVLLKKSIHFELSFELRRLYLSLPKEKRLTIRGQIS